MEDGQQYEESALEVMESNGFSLPHIGLSAGGATLSSVCGNFLRVRDVGDGSESYIECPKTDVISAFAVSPSLDRIALCGGMLEPDLYVYSASSELLCTIAGGSELEYKMLTFSSDGRLLLSVTSEPQLSLNIWLLTEQAEPGEGGAEGAAGARLGYESIVEVEVDLEQFQTLTASASSPAHFVSCGGGSATGWFLRKYYVGYDLSSTPIDAGGRRVRCQAWSPATGDCVLGCADGHLVVVRASSEGKGPAYAVERAVSCAEMAGHDVQALAASAQALVALCPAAGSLVVLRADTLAHSHSVPLAPLGPEPAFLSVQLDVGRNVLYALTARNELVKVGLGGAPASVAVLESSHAGSVTAAAGLPGRRGDLATCSADGTLRVWNFEASAARPALEHRLGAAGPPVQATALAACGPDTLAVGSARGYVRVLRLPAAPAGAGDAAGARVRLLHLSRTHAGAVRQLAYCARARVLASCDDAGAVFFTALGGDAARVLGYLSPLSGAAPLACAWLTGDDDGGDGARAELAVVDRAGGVAVVGCPAADAADPADLCLDGAVPVARMRLETDEQSICGACVSPVRAGCTRFIFVHDSRRGLNTYALHADAVPRGGGGGGGGAAVELVHQAEGHLKVGGVLAVSPDGTRLLSGGRDGSVKLFEVDVEERTDMAEGREEDEEGDAGRRHQAELVSSAESFPHGTFHGGVSAVSFGSGGGQHAFSCGHDGSVYRHAVRYEAAAAPPAGPGGDAPLGAADAVPASEDLEDADAPTAVVAHLAREKELRRERNTEWQERTRARLSAMGRQLRELLNENERSHMLEQLDRDEFTIDEKLRALRERRASEADALLRRRIRAEDIGTMVVRERIKRHCYDSMSVQSNTCMAFDSELFVTSYPLVHESPGYARRLEHVSFLRRVEQDEIAFHAERGVAHNIALELVEQYEGFAGFANGLGAQEADGLGAQAHGDKSAKGGQAASQAGQGGAPGKGDPQAQASAKSGDDAGKGGGEAEQPGEQPGGRSDEEAKASGSGADAPGKGGASRSLLYTAYELNSVQRRISQSFLLRCEVRKQQTRFNEAFAKVKARKLDDIHKIMDLNQRLREINKELGNHDEVVDPGIAPAEESDRILTVQDDEIGVKRFVSREEQARLDEEAKREADRLAKQNGDDPAERALKMMMGGRLDRDKDKDNAADFVRPEWMSQPREALSEEQIKFMKEFEAKEKLWLEEMERQRKALETEYKKIRTDINDIRSRFDDALSELFQQKLDNEAVCTELELQIIRMTILTEQAIEEYEIRDTELQAELEELKSKRGRSAGVIQEFRRELDAMRDLYDSMNAELHAMDRTFRKDLVEAGESNVDVVYRMYKRKNIHHSEHGGAGAGGGAAALAGAGDPAERPEGVSEATWELLIERRRVKHAKEAEVKAQLTKLHEMGVYMTKLSDDDERVKSQIESVLRSRKEIRDIRVRNLLDLEIPLKMKQGQVELDLSRIRVDMSDAFLIDRSVVEEVNEIITRHGEAKTEVLVAIKDFKKGIYELQWENKKLQMEAEDLIEKTKELQLLRVTKNLQSILKHGEETSSQSEVTALEARLEHNKMLHEKHLIERRKHIQKMRSSIEEKGLHNEYLLKQIRELEQTVDNLPAGRVEHLRNQSRNQYDGRARRMRNLMTQRKLQDLSLAQQEEIQMLQTELEKMKLRSFPSFTQEA